MLTLSHSSIDTYLKCRRLYRYTRIQKIRTRKTAIPLVAGRAFHAFKEAWYKGFGQEAAFMALKKEFELDPQVLSLMTKEQTTNLYIEQARMEAIAFAYMREYENDRIQYPKFIMETRGEITLSPIVKYQGYVDCLAQDAAGDWWIIETKTASSGTTTPEYFDRVSFDWQVAGYMAIVKEQLGKYPRGIVYDVVIKTRHSIKKGESPTTFVNRLRKYYVEEAKSLGLFQRHEIALGEKAVERWRNQVTMIANEIASAHNRKEKNWPMNTGNCLGKYGACSHMPICSSGKVDRLLYETESK